MNYKERQRAIAVTQISNRNKIFRGAIAGAKYRGIARDFFLTESEKNLYESIATNVIRYFRKNSISWWGGRKPTGHVLSSQIACLNHLFPFRNDKNSVLAVVRNISPDFVDVLLIDSDKSDDLDQASISGKGYVQFESVSDHDYLNEGNPTRGNNCTSIDALIYAVHKDGSKWLITIEWKYTEHYSNQDKAKEGFKNDPIKNKGLVRLKRYTNLINTSDQLKNNNHSCYYYEPFYQLMRQTLWAEQMVKNKENETIKADNFLHVHVIPTDNDSLLQKKYKCSGKNMEATWREHLIDQSKYQIISPENLLKWLPESKYTDLKYYLSLRYWNI